MAPRTFMVIFFLLVLLEQNFDLIAASRPPRIQPPVLVHTGWSRKPKPPSTEGTTINRYKLTENMPSADAFRPTSPGHSPGVGHESPPGAAL